MLLQRANGTDGQTDGRTDAVPMQRPCRILCDLCQKANVEKNNSCKNISHFLLTSGADLRVTRVISRPSPWRVSLFYVIIMRVT